MKDDSRELQFEQIICSVLAMLGRDRLDLSYEILMTIEGGARDVAIGVRVDSHGVGNVILEDLCSVPIRLLKMKSQQELVASVVANCIHETDINLSEFISGLLNPVEIVEPYLDQDEFVERVERMNRIVEEAFRNYTHKQISRMELDLFLEEHKN